ncbi:MAG: hypothetical protein ACYCUM_10115 [Solirubrobacteraceae bacterium]
MSCTRETALIAKAAKAHRGGGKAHRGGGNGGAKTQTITLASGSYAISAGGSKVLTLTLSRAASRLLTHLRSIAGYLYVTPLGATQPAAVTKLTFKSKAKAKKHKKHKKHKRHGKTKK